MTTPSGRGIEFIEMEDLLAYMYDKIVREEKGKSCAYCGEPDQDGLCCVVQCPVCGEVGKRHELCRCE